MISKAERQTIISDFAQRHGGVYDPIAFVREVQEAGKSHPAYSWFDWDDDKAANEFRIWQARVFAQGLVIRFSIEEVGRGGAMRIVHKEAPMLLSPMDGRQSGGGYIFTDPKDPSHIAMLASEGAASLQAWLKRYSAALHTAGVPERSIANVISALRRAAGEEEKAAAE